jgi:PhzF family phenazine biosynthesis protein
MEIPIYQVDAFADRPFAGNPAPVCPLDSWLPDEVMQRIAAENNLSETAFFVRRGNDFDLRWFTPRAEVDLCGHATLGSAFVVLTRLEPGRESVTFHTRSGALAVEREGERLVMDFPARPPEAGNAPEGLAAALGTEPTEILGSRDALAVFDTAEEIRALKPDTHRIERLDCFAVCVTARGTGADDDVDFVSRFFVPAQGIPEDPVTGSAHSTLVPYWAARLGKTTLRARQVSARGGELWCEHHGDRVRIAGHAVLVMTGTLSF